MRNYLMEDWLMEADIPASTSPPDVMSGSSNQDAFSNNPSITNPPSQNMYNEPKQNQQNQSQDDEDDDFNDDPVNPHMPDDSDQKQKKESFESWKNSYFKESVKGTSEKLLEMINLIRDKGGFTTYQRKFIEDNWNVQLLRQNANIERASNDIRRSIKERLDKHNPSTSLVSHMNAVLETQPLLATIFIKLNGYGSLKADLHRKFLCALFGCVQVGSGAFNEDIIYNEDDYSVAISTRFNSDFGDFYLGNWSLKSSDPERYLSEPELKRMSEGSPEERDVLKRRVILESIANQYLTRSFIFNVVGEDGTVYSIGMDIAGCIKSAVFSIRDFTKYEKLLNTANWKMPFMMDEVAKEIFFMEDGILFLEGQEDVGLLKAETALTDINIFGYGVRGAGNFKFAFTLAQDLGYKKVSCILDKGADEDDIKADLEVNFPSYKIVQWNKNDIRDKEIYTATEKTGYYDKDGKKKDVASLDDFETKLETIRAYLF
jgi:hypothetical protein